MRAGKFFVRQPSCHLPPLFYVQSRRRREERRVFLNPSGERARLSSSGTSGGRTDHRLLNVTIRPEMRGRRRSDRHQMMGETEEAGASMSIRFFHCSFFFFTRWMDGDALFPRLLSPSIILRNGPPCCSEYLPEGWKQGGAACFSIPGVEEPLGPTNYTTKES